MVPGPGFRIGQQHPRKCCKCACTVSVAGVGLQDLANRANRTDVSTGITNQYMNNAAGPVYRIPIGIVLPIVRHDRQFTGTYCRNLLTRMPRLKVLRLVIVTHDNRLMRM